MSLHFQDFNVFCLYISRLQCLWFGVCLFTKRVRVLVKDIKTSMSYVITFSRLQCLLSLHFKTSMSSFVTFQDFNVFYFYISRLQCLLSLHFKTSMSFVFTFQHFNVFFLVLLILHLLILFTGFTALVLASCRSDSQIARMKLVSFALLTFYFQ